MLAKTTVLSWLSVACTLHLIRDYWTWPLLKMCTKSLQPKYIVMIVLCFILTLITVGVQDHISILQLTGKVEEIPVYNNAHATNVMLKKAPTLFLPTAFEPMTSEVALALIDKQKASEIICSREYGLYHKNRTCTLALLHEYEAMCGYFPTQGKWTNQKAGFPQASFQLDICTLPKPGEN